MKQKSRKAKDENGKREENHEKNWGLRRRRNDAGAITLQWGNEEGKFLKMKEQGRSTGREIRFRSADDAICPALSQQIDNSDIYEVRRDRGRGICSFPWVEAKQGWSMMKKEFLSRLQSLAVKWILRVCMRLCVWRTFAKNSRRQATRLSLCCLVRLWRVRIFIIN